MKPGSVVEKYYWLLSPAVICASMAVLLSLDFAKTTFWYDEAYTMAMPPYSYLDIWKITAADAHPPLYYFILKAFCSLFGSEYYSIRIFSALGILACYLLAIFPLRRLAGKGASFVFILLLSVMPVTQYLGVEARMYSWAMFFIMACSIYAYKCATKANPALYAKLVFFTICACYTHYYALLASGIIIIMLGMRFIQIRQSIVPVIILSAIAVIAYLPWIWILAHVGNMEGAWWIKPLTPKDLLLFSYYFFSPKEPSHPYMVFSLPEMSVALAIMLALAATFFVCVVKSQKQGADRQRFFMGNSFILVFVVTIALMLIVSFSIKPLIAGRYLTCALASLLLGVSIYMVQLYKTRTKHLIIISFVLLSLLSAARFFSENAYYKMKQDEVSLLSSFLERGGLKPNVITANPISYPQLAEMQMAFHNQQYVLVSPKAKKDYSPFTIKVSKQFPDTQKLFWVRSIYDSSSVSPLHEAIDSLHLSDLTIFLLKTKTKE